MRVSIVDIINLPIKRLNWFLDAYIIMFSYVSYKFLMQGDWQDGILNLYRIYHTTIQSTSQPHDYSDVRFWQFEIWFKFMLYVENV
jgi:hypothetical protein